MIEARELTKRYGHKNAVSGLSFTTHPAIVTASSAQTAPASR